MRNINNPQIQINKPMHAIEVDQISQLLDTSKNEGLLFEQIPIRQNAWGKNSLPKKQKDGAFTILKRQIQSPLIYILLIAALLTFILREFVDMTVILLVVAVNSSIGFFQEFRANKIFEKLQSIVRVESLVVRNGEIHTIDSEDLVPGDLIILKSGSKVPADARIIETQDLEINEAILTGESVPVDKNSNTLGEKTNLADRTNMVFMGTVVNEGSGKAIVTATGTKTEIGKIASLTQSTDTEQTPLQKRVSKLGKLITQIVVAVSVGIFIIGLVFDHSLTEMLTTSIAVAVAAIPEGLPAAISVILAVSSKKILEKKGLVMRLIAAETLGSTSVICTDKTGTLTYGKMKVEQILSNRQNEALKVLALANEAIIEEVNGKQVVKGEATDIAKMEKFLESGGNYEELLTQQPLIHLVPFHPETKMVSAFNQDEKKISLSVSGAPEKLLALSKLDQKEKQKFIEQYEDLAKRGFRLIGLAQKNNIKIEDPKNIHSLHKQINDLDFLGLAAIRDPIREDVYKTLQTTKNAGIKTLIITGDHLLTAKAVAQELGFDLNANSIITGAEIDNMKDSELQEQIPRISIIARAEPEHKMRVIRAWQSLGAVVAMTGDGVNDAPALKAADIGIAVGSGTDVTKEAADLVLLNNSFNTIVSAIREGRITFQNIKKVTILLLSNAFSEIFLILTALVFSLPFPITAIQILWVNLIEGSLPVLALAFEPGEDGVMRERPIHPKEEIIDSEAKTVIFAVGLITDVILVGIFLFLLKMTSWELIQIQTFIFASIGIDTLMYIFAFKSLKQPFWKSKLFNNKFLLFAATIGFTTLFAAIYLPTLNFFLKTTPLGLVPILIIFAFAMLKFLLVEIVKWWYRHKDETERFNPAQI